ncbi:MAG: hypothetical protein KAT31_17145, partial [Bacteroidales bacterium]|nr:hypothetical protein [Bacteroidales bacterium]
MKKLMLIVSAFLIMLFIGLPAPSCVTGSSGYQEENTWQESFSVKELQTDFKQFRQFLEESHPRLYRFTPRKTFDSLFEAHYQMINRSMTTQEFYHILIPLVAMVGCGHTSLWTPKGYWDRAPQRMFPLGIHARDGQLFVIHSYNQESPVIYGSQIMSINGQDARSLVDEMLGNIWSDGFIMTKRYRRLNNIFPYLYALNYGYPEGFEIVVQEEGREREIKINPIPRLVITAYRDSLVASGTIRREDLVMELKNELAALLTIRTFAYYDDNKGFNRFIDSSFQVIHDLDIQHLVIDLRGNDGGDPFCSTHLLAYLQKKPVIYFREPYGRYARLNKPLPMAENRFSGKQYYLIDGMCFSTTGHLASLLKYYGLGTFIGEETGA